MTLYGAIKQLEQMRNSEYMPTMFKPLFDKVIETVSECEEPGTPKEPHWIPCSERLPEEDGTYIVCLTDGSVFEYDYLVNWTKKWTYVGKEVMAWQPLPEPYRGGDQDG